ncbi:MAG: glycosyltransferase family 4 protein [Chloroflexi bacterium]|nr:glycosyltransferase family 4 protein [Chloroflexota bacterium]
MRVLMLVQSIDEDDWLRAFIVGWVRAIAARVDQVEVITLWHGRADLPDNVRVRSMGKEQGFNRWQELRTFYRALSAVIDEVDILFCHMTPRYSWLAAPLARWRHKPQVLWYTHKHVDWELRLAHALVDRVVTATPESFRLPSGKVRVIGHGIDLSRFQPDSLNPAAAPAAPVIVAVGRLAPIKNLDALIRAVPHLLKRPGLEGLRVEIVGAPAAEGGMLYQSRLADLIDDLDIAEQVRLPGPLPFDDMPDLYRRADLSVNLCPTGGADKAVLESMASGLPVVVHNQTFLPLLRDHEDLLWVPQLDPEMIADHIASALALPDDQRRAITRDLRQRVEADFGLDSLADRLVAEFEAML